VINKVLMLYDRICGRRLWLYDWWSRRWIWRFVSAIDPKRTFSCWCETRRVKWKKGPHFL